MRTARPPTLCWRPPMNGRLRSFLALRLRSTPSTSPPIQDLSGARSPSRSTAPPACAAVQERVTRRPRRTPERGLEHAGSPGPQTLGVAAIGPGSLLASVPWSGGCDDDDGDRSGRLLLIGA